MNKLTIILLALVATITNLSAQSNSAYHDDYQSIMRHSVGFNLGPTIFHGDADQTKPGIIGGLFYKYSISPMVGIKMSGNLGVLKGGRSHDKFVASLFGNSNDDPSMESYEFKNKIWNLDATVNIILGNLSHVKKPRPTHLYLIAGFGIMGANVEGSWKDKNDLNNPFLKTSPDTILTFKGINAMGPVGFGIAKKLNTKLDLGVEYRFNYTRKDVLDAYNFPVWKNRTFDTYSTLGFNLTYKILKSGATEHMDWISPTNDAILDKSRQVKDADGDGVADKFDAEPATPKGAKVYGNGVAVDSDQDGVPDYRDDEIFSTSTKVDGKGIALDGDNDGVADTRDEEANTPAGSIVDKMGRKVEIKSASSASSCCDCNEVNLPSIFVDEDNEFRPEAYSALYLIGTKLQQCPEVSIDLIGFYGMNKSSEQSARAKTNLVIEYLVTNFGISRTKFNTQTKPETMGGKYSKQRIDIKAKK